MEPTVVSVRVTVALLALATLAGCSTSEPPLAPTPEENATRGSASSTAPEDSVWAQGRSSPTTIIVPASEPNANTVGATQAATAEASIGTLWWEVQADDVKVYEIDFFGALASAQTSEFQVSTGDVSTGGPNSEQRVGPAHLVLDDGATITIAPGTPGGNMCRAFGNYPGDANEVTCFVVGAFKPETTEAQWFALIPSLAGYLDVAGFGDRAAQFSMDDRSRFELPVRTDARLVGCPAGDLFATPMQVPEAADFYASFNAADEVVVIECAADY